MNAPSRRGACPTLAAPMLTGDGWLARLTPAAGLTPAQLAGLGRGGGAARQRADRGHRARRAAGARACRAASARRTGRGGRRARGSCPESGLPVLTGPLAGLDAGEIADPRPLADVSGSWRATLGLDGGWARKFRWSSMAAARCTWTRSHADVRLLATRRGTPAALAVAAGGTARPPAHSGATTRPGSVLVGSGCSERLADQGARAREPRSGGRGPCGIAPADCEPPGMARRRPIGRFGLARRRRRLRLRPALRAGREFRVGRARGGGGRAAFLRPAPGRALIAVAPEARRCRCWRESRGGWASWSTPGDPRLAVVACSGAPALPVGASCHPRAGGGASVEAAPRPAGRRPAAAPVGLREMLRADRPARRHAGRDAGRLR